MRDSTVRLFVRAERKINELAELKACYSAFGKARTKRITKHVEARFKTFRDGGSNPPASILLYSRQLLFFKMCQFRTGTSILQISRRHHLLVILILGTLFAVCPAYCSTYFVATDGNDTNIGDINHPFKTIPRAVTAVAVGDTIYLRGGIHDFYTDANKISISKSGQDGNLITLQNYQNETVILDFSHQTRGGTVRGINLSGNYWYFKGFTLRNAGDNGLYVSGSYNTFEQLIAYGNQDTGINLYASSSGLPAYNQVINCDSYLNYDPQTNGGNADGFGAKGPTPPGGVPPPTYSLGPGNVFKGCRAWYNSDDGFDLWWASNSVRIENCWAFRNGNNIWGDPCWAGNGVGIKLGQGAGAHKIIHCMAYYNRLSGFDLNRSHGDIEVNGVTVYNCTGVSNQDKNFKFSNPPAGTIHVLRNNLSHLGSVTIGTQIVNTYNSWNGFTVTNADFASLDPNFPPITDPNTYDNTNSVGIDQPRGPDGELPKLRFLRLANTSALIDAGIDVNLPFYGDAPDLGAFEHLDGDCEPDGDVDWADLGCLASNWLNSSCGTCNGADFDGNHKVDFYDFVILAENWLKG
jgi:hypothetical protein